MIPAPGLRSGRLQEPVRVALPPHFSEDVMSSQLAEFLTLMAVFGLAAVTRVRTSQWWCARAWLAGGAPAS